MHNLERKLEDANTNLINIKDNYKKYVKNLPSGRTTEMENEAWLDEIKKEVHEKGLLSILHEDEAGMPEVLTAKSLGVTVTKMSNIGDPFTRTSRPSTKPRQSESKARPSDTKAGLSEKRESNKVLPSAPTILMAPRRFDTRRTLERKSRVPIYDLDFDLDDVAKADSLDMEFSKEEDELIENVAHH